MCGLSYYLITFKYEGFIYSWRTDLECYYSNITQKKFNKPPEGATWDDSCWVSQWRYEDD